MFGKIHGLENIAYLSDEQLDNIHDPVSLQLAINNVVRPKHVASSYEEFLNKNNLALQKYKEGIEKLGLYPSDKTKLLALPFYLAKRKQYPEPKKG